MSTADAKKNSVHALMESLNNKPEDVDSVTLSHSTLSDVLSYIRDLERDKGKYEALYEQHKQKSAQNYQLFKSAEIVKTNIEKEYAREAAAHLRTANAFDRLEHDFIVAMSLLKRVNNESTRAETYPAIAEFLRDRR